MSTITNKSFWEKEEVIQTQDLRETVSPTHETYLMKRVLEHFNSKQLNNTKVKIFGCGTGREINEIHKAINPKAIVASDISENMIKNCGENLKLWSIEDKVTLHVTPAQEYNGQEDFDATTILNSMLTYVHKREDRLTILQKAKDLLHENGCAIGTVHNQEGVFKKTMYFKLRKLLKPFLKNEVGFRYTGFKGFKVKGYYYNKKGLLKDLNEVGFKNIDVYSLEELFDLQGKKYNRTTGYNNLIFFATKN